MPENTQRTPKTTENIIHFLKALEMPSKELTKWELGFIADLDDQFMRRGSLSDKQFEILERIYAEKTY